VPTSLAELETQALRLTPLERADLADRLLASLSLDDEADASLFVEADRRLAELESGAVAGVPVEDVIARARTTIR
jgi:putative addiction module component (TIGR02574 family)